MFYSERVRHDSALSHEIRQAYYEEVDDPEGKLYETESGSPFGGSSSEEEGATLSN